MIPPANIHSTSEEVAGMAGHSAESATELGSPPPIAPTIFTPTANGGDYISRSRLKPVSGKFEMIPPEDEHFMAERVDRPLAFMACGNSAETLRSSELRERVFTALAHGHKYLDRPHLSVRNLPQLTDHQIERVFPIEAGKLDAILFKPWKVRPNKEGYWPDYEDLEELRNLLEARRYAAEGDFRQARKAPPSIPFWGRDLTANGYVHSPNDFEILGVCFRREVEYFLARLSELHQFDEEPFWDNGPSFLGHYAEPLSSENPRQTRRERRAARKSALVTPVVSPLPPPATPRKPNRDSPPHLRYPYAAEEDLTVSRYGQARHSREPVDEAGASNSRRIKREDGRAGVGGDSPRPTV
ncbi:hypothetical protein NUW54_g7101 [Trametes sanguinea]|uniref:Uncharacterized protein n=1 Tax=Trametes sanguinea TaxID=158606 RepID=A0ACC1PQF7_9APHY|nr:hypothetical protein NUW54_g7101 [Trametes sanguinea]